MKIRIKNQKNEQNIWGRFNSETKIAKENQGRCEICQKFITKGKQIWEC